jgi:dipeptidyl aminopeptidase/acylaminoacyl peptidase
MTTRRFAWIACLILLSVGIGAVSAQRSARPTAYNVFYDPEGDRARLLDVYLPESGEAPYPVVLTFHGAGGDKTNENRDGIVPFMIEQGYAVVAVNYAVAIPEGNRDAACALAWVYANAEEQGFDRERIALYGTSFWWLGRHVDGRSGQSRAGSRRLSEHPARRFPSFRRDHQRWGAGTFVG